MTISPLPPAPSRANDTPQQFSDKADALAEALPSFVNQTNQTVAEVDQLAANAASSASASAQSATNALAAQNSANATANVTLWTSGTTYNNGQAVYSGVNYLTYRRKTATGSGTLDPSQDPANWTQVTGPKAPDFVLINSGVI